MKNYKRLAAMAMTSTMLLGNVMPAFAAEGGASGDGAYEGYVEEVSAFSVEVPTDASSTKGFDFFVDPNGLLAATDYARIDGATEEDFEANASLFFERTPVAAGEGVDAVVKYGKDSEALELTNMSSYDVNVEVSATVAGANGVTLAESAPAADATDPTLYLAIVSGTETKAITANGGKFEGTIAGEPDNFEVQYDKDAGKYVYAQIEEDAENGIELKEWKSVSFNLTGACGGTWTDAQATVAPTVNLTWKVTDPKAAPADTYVMTENNGAISYTFAVKPEGTTVTALEINERDRIGAYTAGNATYDSETGVFTINAAAATNTGIAEGGTVKVTIGDVQYTLTYTK